MSSKAGQGSSSKKIIHAKLAELRALKAAGKTRLQSYKVTEEDQVYDLVDEKGYRAIVRQRLNEEDFVVDDHGEGYADNGIEEWGNSEIEMSSEEEKVYYKEKEKKAKSGKMEQFFKKKTAIPTIKPTTEEDMDFMADILGKIDSEETELMLKKKELASIPQKRLASPPSSNSRAYNRLEKASAMYRRQKVSSSPMRPESNDYDLPSHSSSDIMSSNLASKTYALSSPIKPTSEKLKTESENEDDFEVKELAQYTFLKNKDTFHKESRTNPITLTKPSITETKPFPMLENVDASSWLNLNNTLNVVNNPENSYYTGIKENFRDFIEEDNSLKMYWLDYTEFNNSLCLFGKTYNKKTKNYVSCFIQIHGIMRNLYFLPRDFKLENKESKQEVSMSDVYEEVSNLLARFKINEFKSKSATRKYAFEIPDVPYQCDYLKVLYPYTEPSLPQDISGNTFSRVFGINTPLFEQFVLYKRIMGPCWLHIKQPCFEICQNFSWCKLELGVINPEYIFPISESDLKSPPLTLMSIAIRKIINDKENKQEIVVASMRIYENISLDDPTPANNLPCQTFTIVRPIQQFFPIGFESLVKTHKGTIKIEKTESSLLNCLLTKIQNVDPDIYLGHEWDNLDLNILLSRMKEKKIMNWHRIGRHRKKEWPKISGRSGIFAEKLLISGRLSCDLANELGRSLIKAQSWTLSELCDLHLGIKRHEFDDKETILSWTNTAKGMMEYLIHCEVDTYFIAAIAFKIQILPLTKQLTNLSGNNWAKTLSGSRAERNEYILLHEFNREKYICPDKALIKSKILDIEEEEEEELSINTSLKKKDKYKGGLVFEPIKGLYDKYILLMDFNSLYPSIIQEYNICFTTVNRHDCEKEDEIPEFPDEQAPQGILPRLIATLVNRRKQIKNLLKDKNASIVQKIQWDIKQQALKLTANSMYGCLGYTKSRFYAKPLAVLITYKGREILRNTKELASNLNLQVIYGDTDSIMINTNIETYEEAIKIGNEFKKHVNERYKFLEIDIDNVYQRMLLHAKKKYAALHLVEIDGKMEPKIDVKGLDMKRREYCILAKEASSDFANKMRDGKFQPAKFIIYNKLGKNPEEYPNGKSMPHVQVALKKKEKGEIVKVNDIIAYIITCNENDNRHVAERACPPQEVIKSSSIKIDYNYYLANQILPPIERLCGPIEGTDRTRLAECLGLDIRKYQINEVNSEYKFCTYESRLTDEERFKDAKGLILTCNECNEKMDFKGLAKSKEFVNLEGIFCICGKKFPIYTISAQLESQIRNQNDIYYNAWLLCDDPSCANRTRQIGVYGKRCSIKNCQGQMRFEYSDKTLYNQLLYYDSLFDVDKARAIANNFPNPESILICAEHNRERFEKLRYVTKLYLNHNKRRFVNLQSIFSF
ncbi:hypothetical protein MERGE_000760 [Pneumocystis wakefieldiae]|uniref:DNA polymerase n=1 Tax=Pneumocystis wakefieldiae TaxID=38082 RepID=A0A899FX56_9ASCO|nr:hypothetical protein MERGE_000760 [Pneumocystis wakefieldiae]